MSFHKIFVALDPTELGSQVFSKALDIAKLYNADLMLFHILSVTALGETGIPIAIELGLNVELMDQAYAAQRARLERDLGQVQTWLHQCYNMAASLGLKTEFDCKAGGEVGPAICEAARNWGADLIVMGRRGRTGLAEVFLGSVSNYVLHRAACSVLVIQPGNEV